MRRRYLARTLCASLAFSAFCAPALSAQNNGYYRQPSIRGNTIVFVSEGDLWVSSVNGGQAQRLTTNLAEETNPTISPDGRTIAFVGRYDGNPDVYTIPISGGVPKRVTWTANAAPVNWTDDGKIIWRTNRYSTLPNNQLFVGDKRIELAQAYDGAYMGNTLFFVRTGVAAPATRMYMGGTAQKIWKFDGRNEAACLTCDWKGTSKSPRVWNNRVYFLSDRTDNTMNVWSMTGDGKDLKQVTFHNDYEVRDFAIDAGKLVYQQGADLHIVNVSQPVIAKASSSSISIGVSSDMDQLRDRWVKRPADFLTEYHIDKTGDRVSLIARGMLFIAPVGQGRFVSVPNNGSVRYRNARFGPGNSLFTLNDKSGEVELWKDGVQLTNDAKILRWDLEVSPDGKYIAHDDKNQRLYVTDVATRNTKLINESKYDGFGYFWMNNNTLLYQTANANSNSVIYQYDVASVKSTPLTTDRFNSYSPAVTPDGVWLYFLSDRTFNSSVGSPWGLGAPMPYFNNQTKIYAIQLKRGPRFPFAPKTELDKDTVEVKGILEVPVPAGNYNGLSTDGKRLYVTTRDDRYNFGGGAIKTVEFGNQDVKLETFVDGTTSYELSGDAKKVLFRKSGDLYVVPAAAKAPSDLSKNKVDLSGWMMPIERKEEMKQLFADAWRLERDYFYDPGMHGLDWKAIRTKYEPLAARVSDRSELNDVIAQMVSELSALHIRVNGGDLRAGADTIPHSSLGAALEKVDGGWKVAHIYRNDPDILNEQSPLARPGVDVSEGDVITAINGVSLATVENPAALLIAKAGKQTLVETANGKKAIVYPMSLGEESSLRYAEWEYQRKQIVDKLSNGRVGYIHLRCMGQGDINQFARDFYHQFNKEALVFDVRNNCGGNIDSWLLTMLSRKPWMYWQSRVGEPSWNMQFAFNGPMATMVNENSGSDGEAFPEGFRRLGLGKVYGTRTWGGEIWLSSSNVLADRGIATAAEMGVYADGKWLIEQHGVDPDVVVDNLPFSTFNGSDVQLETTVNALLAEVEKRGPAVPKAPAYPTKIPR